jgi:hypothetical protein
VETLIFTPGKSTLELLICLLPSAFEPRRHGSSVASSRPNKKRRPIVDCSFRPEVLPGMVRYGRSYWRQPNMLTGGQQAEEKFAYVTRMIDRIHSAIHSFHRKQKLLIGFASSYEAKCRKLHGASPRRQTNNLSTIAS